MIEVQAKEKEVMTKERIWDLKGFTVSDDMKVVVRYLIIAVIVTLIVHRVIF